MTARLRDAGRVVQDELYAHSVPVCWRCKSHVLFRLVYEWFISVDDVREPMLAAARTVEWEPPHIGSRMDDWLHNMGDWCISRKRYWGLPLPFYRCDDCNELTVVGSRAELRERALDPTLVDDAARAAPAVDRRHQDHVRVVRCARRRAFPRSATAGSTRASSPFSTLGYFDDPEGWKQRFPAEWISRDARAGAPLVLLDALHERRARRPRAVRAGAVVRACDLRDRREVLEDGPHDPLRRRGAGDRRRPDPIPLLPAAAGHRVPVRVRSGRASAAPASPGLWNIASFFVTYAGIDRVEMVEPTTLGDALHVTDRWLLARTAQLVDVATDGDAPRGHADDGARGRAVHRRGVELVRARQPPPLLARRRERRATSRRVTRRCSKPCGPSSLVLAPIVPFVTDELWQQVIRPFDDDAAESVHHALWPEAPDAVARRRRCSRRRAPSAA